MRVRWLRWGVLVMAGLLIVGILGLGLSWALATSFNVTQEENKLVLLVGSARLRTPPGTVSFYRRERTELLQRLAEESPDRVMRAVVVLNRFVSPEEADGFLANTGLTGMELFLGIPGTTVGGGAGMIGVSAKEAYARHMDNFQQMVREINSFHPDPASREEFRRLGEKVRRGAMKVYAVTVEGRLKDLRQATGRPEVAFVDLFYHPKAEEVSRATGKVIHYRVIPDRPDGMP